MRELSFKRVARAAVVKDLDIARGALVEAVFNGHIVDETLGRVLSVFACADLSSDDYANAVVPEAFGKLEGIVGGFGACGARVVFHADGEVDGFQCTASDVLDFALKEGVEGVAGLESATTRSEHIVGHIHARGEHGHRRFAPLVGRHRGQLVLHREVFRRFNDERQTHIVERLRDLHTHIERHGARLVVFNHRCPHALLGGDIERWVHHVAREVDITSLDDIERLERDDG